MQSVVIYTTRFCGYCLRAKALLESKGVTYQEIPVDGDPQRRSEMMTRSGRHTVPQIWIGDRHIGGSNELHQLEAQGKLDDLLG